MRDPKSFPRPEFCLGRGYRKNTWSLKSGEVGGAGNSRCHRKGYHTKRRAEAKLAGFENGFLLMDRDEASNNNNNNKHITDVSSIIAQGISSYQRLMYLQHQRTGTFTSEVPTSNLKSCENKSIRSFH